MWHTQRETALVIGSTVIMLWGSRECGSSFPKGALRPTAGAHFAWISERCLRSWSLARATGFFSSLIFLFLLPSSFSCVPNLPVILWFLGHRSRRKKDNDTREIPSSSHTGPARPLPQTLGVLGLSSSFFPSGLPDSRSSYQAGSRLGS